MASRTDLASFDEPVQRRPSGALTSFRRNLAAMLAMVFILLVAALAVGADWLTPYDPTISHNAARGLPPMTVYEPSDFDLNRCHWLETPLEPLGCRRFLLGSGISGADIFSQTVYGGRTSILVALVASLTSLTIGIAYGTVAGFTGGTTDELMMRLVDFLYALPVFMVALGIQSFFQFSFMAQEGWLKVMTEWNNRLGGLLFLFIAIGAVNWVAMARMSRALVHAAKRTEYVESARAVGASDGRILMRHLLPNVIGPLVIVETLAIPGYIFLEATLSFLGLGVGPTGISWGSMINAGYSAIRSYPHVILVPSIALSLLTLAFNFAGDGLRDAVDPRQR
jgi:oligopeptide transport system permease protein